MTWAYDVKGFLICLFSPCAISTTVYATQKVTVKVIKMTNLVLKSSL